MTRTSSVSPGVWSRRFRSVLLCVCLLLAGAWLCGSLRAQVTPADQKETQVAAPSGNAPTEAGKLAEPEIPELRKAPPGMRSADEEEKEEGLPQAAPILVNTKYFKVSSSMVVTWVVAILLIVGAQTATRQIKEIPEGAQNFWEWVVEGLYNFLEGIVGDELVKKTFWFFASVFLFILATNWFGLLPGIGSLWIDTMRSGHVEHIPFMRGANADLNMTLAMAMVFFACWIFWALQANGLFGFLLHLFGPKGETEGFMKVLMVFVFLCVGVLEVVSILFRPISLSFRLYGNIFAGENMLEAMSHMGGVWFGWLLPIPFYFMELLVGLVQALVFMLLTAVFTLLICQHEEHEHH